MQIFLKLHYFKIILKSVLIPLNSYTDVLQSREERSTLFLNKVIYKNKEIVIIDRATNFTFSQQVNKTTLLSISV